MDLHRSQGDGTRFTSAVALLRDDAPLVGSFIGRDEPDPWAFTILEKPDPRPLQRLTNQLQGRALGVPATILERLDRGSVHRGAFGQVGERPSQERSRCAALSTGHFGDDITGASARSAGAVLPELFGQYTSFHQNEQNSS